MGVGNDDFCADPDISFNSLLTNFLELYHHPHHMGWRIGKSHFPVQIWTFLSYSLQLIFGTWPPPHPHVVEGRKWWLLCRSRHSIQFFANNFLKIYLHSHHMEWRIGKKTLLCRFGHFIQFFTIIFWSLTSIPMWWRVGNDDFCADLDISFNSLLTIFFFWTLPTTTPHGVEDWKKDFSEQIWTFYSYS